MLSNSWYNIRNDGHIITAKKKLEVSIVSSCFTGSCYALKLFFSNNEIRMLLDGLPVFREISFHLT